METLQTRSRSTQLQENAEKLKHLNFDILALAKLVQASRDGLLEQAVLETDSRYNAERTPTLKIDAQIADLKDKTLSLKEEIIALLSKITMHRSATKYFNLNGE